MGRPTRYVLDERGEATPCEDLIEWGRWMEKADRHVGDDVVGDARVSTVFLGLDHNFADDGPPILWETLVFGGPLDGEGERYDSRQAAERGHVAWVERAERAAQ